MNLLGQSVHSTKLLKFPIFFASILYDQKMKIAWVVFTNILFCLCFAKNVDAHQFKDCTILKEKCFELQNSPQKPFYMKGTDLTKVAVLVHGLSDSPYFTKDIALLLNSQGYYVYSVLLSGHGTQIEDINGLKYQDWVNDVISTIFLAQRETGAKQVLLEGFSMGGALVTYFAEHPVWKNRISKLILMAPAFKIQSIRGRFMCATGTSNFKTWAWDRPITSPVKYNKMTIDAVCELTQVGALTRMSSNKVTVPVFMALTKGDKTIDNNSAMETYINMNSSIKDFFYVDDLNTSHTDLNFKSDLLEGRKNPKFETMEKRLIRFLNN